MPIHAPVFSVHEWNPTTLQDAVIPSDPDAERSEVEGESRNLHLPFASLSEQSHPRIAAIRMLSLGGKPDAKSKINRA